MTSSASDSIPSALNQHKREVDEISVASDFSIIPESLVGLDEEQVGNKGRRTISTGSFLHSEDLLPSLRAMETHNKVTFQGVRPTYYTDSDIPVCLSLGANIGPKSSDRIGLYKVGFTSPQDYVTYQWSPAAATTAGATGEGSCGVPITVIFKAHSLPKEVGEFYQFCYVTHEGQIVGVSAPFQLLAVGCAGDGVCEVVDEEEGMLVVRSEESVLQDKMNKLTHENDLLSNEVSELKSDKITMSKKIEDLTQQLNMATHHVEALEVKMKRETAEKCEIMGRIGQVVEEKGNLEEKVKMLQKNFILERQRAEESDTKLKELEDALLVSRKNAEETKHTLGTMERDLNDTKHKLEVACGRLSEEKAEKEKAVKELVIWTTTAQADLSEKNSLANKYAEMNQDFKIKLNELEDERKRGELLKQRLEEATKELEGGRSEMEGLEKRLEAMESERGIQIEREDVLGRDNTSLQQDNSALKEKLRHLEDEQRNDQRGREAAETIAGDLSARLQTTREEYQKLAQKYRKVTKKLKKIAREKENQLTTSITSCATNSTWAHVEGPEEELSSEEDEPRMNQSCYSQTTDDLRNIVEEKMAKIKLDLSAQIDALKSEFELRNSMTERDEQVEMQEGVRSEEGEPRSVVSRYSQITDLSNMVNEKMGSVRLDVLTTTATPTATTTTTTATPIQSQPQSTLPPPLLPTATQTARHAEILSRLTQRAPEQQATAEQFESRELQEQEQQEQERPQAEAPNVTSAEEGSEHLSCPLCFLHFPKGTQTLLQEHVNNHLEYVCPVCSMVFQRNSITKFQTHVQEHFKREDEQEEEERRREAEDSSGPWGRLPSLRNLLEID